MTAKTAGPILLKPAGSIGITGPGAEEIMFGEGRRKMKASWTNRVLKRKRCRLQIWEAGVGNKGSISQV